MATVTPTLRFLAIEAGQEAEGAFTAPFVVIEGVDAVPASSAFRSPG